MQWPALATEVREEVVVGKSNDLMPGRWCLVAVAMDGRSWRGTEGRWGVSGFCE